MGWARARRVDESLRQRSSGSNNHKTPAGAAAAPQAKRTLPSNHASFTLTAHAARTRHRSSSTCPLPTFARPVPQFRFRRQPFASTAKKQQQSITEKKENFFHLFEGFPATHTPPHILLHFAFYICTYIFVVSKKKRFFFFVWNSHSNWRTGRTARVS